MGRNRAGRDHRPPDKAVVAVVRRAGVTWEVLAFDHPLAGTQLVKGTVESGESPAEAARRELQEESGLVVDGVGAELDPWQQPDRERWHLFVVPAPPSLPDRWSHLPTGSPTERALVFHFRWLPIDDGLAQHLHPAFAAAARALTDHHR